MLIRDVLALAATSVSTTRSSLITSHCKIDMDLAISVTAAARVGGAPIMASSSPATSSSSVTHPGGLP